MSSDFSSAPAFGQADLSNCEREQIHLAGSIQPHGALLVIRESDNAVVQASANAAEFLNLDKDPLGSPVEELGGDLMERIRPHLCEPLDTIPVALRCRLGNPAATCDGLLHRPPAGGLIIELERAGDSQDRSETIDGALRRLLAATSLRTLCDDAATVVKDLIGYDRVMVYRFDDEGHGEIFAEQRERDLAPLLGMRYPASDIPQIARRLYERNRIRVLVDVDYEPVPLRPKVSPVTGEELDMSLCILRSTSPIHVQYLKNMGVAATLVASLMVGGKLWGLIACHHYEPRFVHYEDRAMCELLAEFVAIRIATLESHTQGQAEIWVQRLEQSMIDAIARDGDWKAALFEDPETLLSSIRASGAALLSGDKVYSAGNVPGEEQLRGIGEWLDRQDRAPVFVTASLAGENPALAALTPAASGVIATPISETPGEYLIGFRPERVRTVTWGGDPNEPVIVTKDPSVLSPRRSFAQWHQTVQGTSDPWTPADIRAGRLIGSTVADVVVRLQTLRALLARTPVTTVEKDAQDWQLPVIVADPSGRVLLATEAVSALLQIDLSHLSTLDDLALLFGEPEAIRERLRDLVERQEYWHGEVRRGVEPDSGKLLVARAAAIYSSPGTVWGYAVLFSERGDRNAAETALADFQAHIDKRRRSLSTHLGAKPDSAYHNMLASIVDNADSAAREITGGVEFAEMPLLLDGVQTSVARAAELLEQLIAHAATEADSGD